LHRLSVLSLAYCICLFVLFIYIYIYIYIYSWANFLIKRVIVKSNYLQKDKVDSVRYTRSRKICAMHRPIAYVEGTSANYVQNLTAVCLSARCEADWEESDVSGLAVCDTLPRSSTSETSKYPNPIQRFMSNSVKDTYYCTL